jgi:hypothetical protein
MSAQVCVDLQVTPVLKCSEDGRRQLLDARDERAGGVEGEYERIRVAGPLI